MGKFNTLCCAAASRVKRFSQLISYRWQVTKTLRPNACLFLTKISFKCGQFCGWATKNYSHNTIERISNTPFTISVHFSINLMKMDGCFHLQSISLVLLFRGTSLSARLMFSWSLWILMRYRQQERWLYVLNIWCLPLSQLWPLLTSLEMIAEATTDAKETDTETLCELHFKNTHYEWLCSQDGS